MLFLHRCWPSALSVALMLLATAAWQYTVFFLTPTGSIQNLARVQVDSGEFKDVGDLAMPAPK